MESDDAQIGDIAQYYIQDESILLEEQNKNIHIHMSEINLNKVLNYPLTPTDWSNLEHISKMVNEYMNKCIKNREYVEAQKAKEKIEEVNEQTKARRVWAVEQKRQQTIRKMKIKHDEEMDTFVKEWEFKIISMEKKLSEVISKRMKMNKEQREKMKEQIDLALPTQASPDQKLKNLRHEERNYASMGNFLQAQRVKQRIQDRERYLHQKHQQLRNANIQQIMEELEQKHSRDIEEREEHRSKVIGELKKEMERKMKQLQFAQAKEIKQIIWVFNEEARIAGS